MSDDMAIKRWKPYPAYKDSGVEWLGQVPEGWEVKRLSYVCCCLDGFRVPLNALERGQMQGDVPYWGANGVLDYVDEALFDDELVLLGEDGAPFNDRLKSVAFLSHGKIWPNNHIHVLKADRSLICSNYLVYILNSVEYAYYINGSTRDKLTQSQMNSIALLCPSIDVQLEIASFLDHQCARIDALIEKKRRLLELLEEKRRAVITQAVTRGLGLDAPMKDSGVEWLGQVPASWSVLALKRAWDKCEYGISDSLSGSGNTRVLTMGHLQDGKVVLPENGCIDDVPRTLILSNGDLLYNRTNSLEHVGKTGIFYADSGGPVSFASYLVRIIPSQYAISPYLNYLLNCQPMRELARRLALPSINQANLTTTRYGLVILALPSVEEQYAIVAHLDTATAAIDAQRQAHEKSIALLQEYRASLITHAVTGKIDVRDYAPQQ